MGIPTPNLSLYKPAIGETGYGPNVDTNFDILDSFVGNAWLNVKAPPFNAKGDGVTDDSVAFQSAINAISAAGGGTLFLPPSNYAIKTGLVNLGNNLTVLGAGGAWFLKLFNGDLFTVGGTSSNIRFHRLNVDAQGAIYTGEVVTFATGSAHVEWSSGIVFNGADSVFLFAADGGVETIVHDSLFVLDVSHTAAGAVVKQSGPDTGAAPRHFHDCFGLSGTRFYSGTGFQGVTFTKIYSSGITFTGSTTLNCIVNACRLNVSGVTCIIDGNSVLVTDCEIGGNLTINASCVNSLFANNIMDPSKTFTNNAPASTIVTNPITQTTTLINGIKFPAVQSAQADVNTLDDYAEGTWTPSVGGSATYFSQVGTYTKVGRLVTLTCNLQLNAIGTGNQQQISGLPFTAAAYASATVQYALSATNVTNVCALILNGGSTIGLYATTAASNSNVLTNILGNSTTVLFSLTYITST